MGTGTGTPATGSATWELGDYCTLEDVRSAMNISTAKTGDDTKIANLIHDCSREIDTFCRRRFYGESGTRYYDAIRDQDGQDLYLDFDLAAVTSITLGDGTTVGNTEYILLPPNHSPKYGIRLKASSSKAWGNYTTNPENAITIVGTWGYVSGTLPPKDIKRACVALVQWRYRQQYAPNADAGMGDISTYNVQTGLPQDVQRMLTAYMRPRIGAIGDNNNKTLRYGSRRW